MRRVALAAGMVLMAVTAALVAAPASGRGNAAVPPAAKEIQLILPLTADLSGLDRFAAAVTTPGSPQYAQFQPISALTRRFGAPQSTRLRVAGYLRRAGATAVRIDPSGLFVVATMGAGLAQRLFATPLEQVRAAGASFVAPAAPPTVPGPLRGLVTGVVGLDTQPLHAPDPVAPAARASSSRAARQPLAASAAGRGPRAASAQPSSAYFPASGTQSGCAQGRGTGGFTPNQYLTAYRLGQLQSEGLRGGGQRVALVEVDGFRGSDIQTFSKCFGIRVPRIHAFGVGVRRPLPPGPEATLDLEVLTAAAPRLTGIDVYETTANAAGSLKAFVAPLENPGFRPQVISVSLGLCEPAIKSALGQSGINLAEAEFKLAAASGVSVLAASGDSGSADCTQPDGTPDDFLAVNFPASSPWVTAVGGTNILLNRNNTLAAEVVWNDTNLAPGSAGGGGPSILFGRPSYQNGTVGGATRALPDVSMLADLAPGYAVYCTAKECLADKTPPWQSVGGTSASTPLLAGGVALIDQLLQQRQRANLGQLNPLLYRIGRSSLAPGVFNDVTRFGNDVGPYIPGNHQPLGCCTAGPGYDEASGWGSVNFAGLAADAVLLQPKAANVKLSLPRHQRPVARHAILATVSCSQSCLMAAFAEVSIDHGKPFTVQSKVKRLNGAGRKTISIGFSGPQLNRLRTALANHRLIRAFVYGVTVSPQHDIERETGGTLLTIRS